jgi:hypothetical protein
MNCRFHPEKRASQIVFDITGGDTQLRSMNLSTIPNKAPMVKSETECYNLRVDDIPGARYVAPKVTQHHCTLDVTDISGAATKPMVQEHKTPVDVMRLDDIEGSRPKVVRQLPHSQRMLNPVDPKYKMPSAPPIVPLAPRFIRNSLYNDDVEGAKPMSYRTDKPPRDLLRTDDIDGCKPAPQARELSGASNSLNVRDINTDGLHPTTRHVNPLTPVYVYDGMEKDVEDFGRVKPQPAAHQGQDRLVDVSDIEGTHPDASTKRYHAFRQPKTTPEDEVELGPAPILMVPSMAKQTQELERQQAMRIARGERIRLAENRSLHAEGGTGDPMQALLRRQREERLGRRQSTFH